MGLFASKQLKKSVAIPAKGSEGQCLEVLYSIAINLYRIVLSCVMLRRPWFHEFAAARSFAETHQLADRIIRVTCSKDDEDATHVWIVQTGPAGFANSPKNMGVPSNCNFTLVPPINSSEQLYISPPFLSQL